MSIHAEKHAAAADMCQPNGVQSDVDLRKWAIQTILLSPHPLPSSMERLESSSLRLASFAKYGTLFPEFRSVEDASLFGRRIKSGNKDVCGFQSIKNFALIVLKLSYSLLNLFWLWFHKESPFGVVDKQRMDDGGRHGDVPPNATCECGSGCFQK